MKTKRQRIRRIADVRDKELKQHVAELRDAQRREAEAMERVVSARDAATRAEEARRNLSYVAADALTFMETEEWLASQSYELDVAQHKLMIARRSRGRAQVKVLQSRTKIRQLEKLEQRLLASEDVEQRRRERRAQDELAGRRGAGGGGRHG